MIDSLICLLMTYHLDLIKPKTINLYCVLFCLQNKGKKQKGIISLLINVILS